MSAGEVTNAFLVDEWLIFMEAGKGRLLRTIETYRQCLAKLVEFLEGRLVTEATAEELEVFTGIWLHRRGVIARSRKTYISCIRGFYVWLYAKGHVQDKAAEGLEHPKAGKALPRVITLANAEKMMWAPDMSSFIGVRDACMLGLLIGCGMRVTGVVSLNESSLVVIEIECEPRMVVRAMEKGGKERIIPVPREVEMLLRVYLAHEEMANIDRSITLPGGRRDKVLFVSVRSTRLQPHEHIGEKRRLTRKAVDDMVKRYGNRLEIPPDQLHAHAMRHLFGTELAESDTPTKSIGDLMGHVDSRSTDVYLHLAMRKKMATMDKAAPMAKMRTPVSELLKRLPKG